MSKKILIDDFINRSNLIHNFKYDYSKVYYVDNKTKVSIICKKHNIIFSQRPDSHLRGVGCSICGEEKFKITQSKKLNKIIEDFNIFHNYNYDYSLMKYKNAHTKILITCKKCGNSFNQTPNTHLRCGCPICKESKGEKNIEKYLLQNNIIFQRQKKFNDCMNKSRLLFDFYLSEYNMCIEYDGLQHFKPVKLFGGDNGLKIREINDEIKNKYCKENNIDLLRIKYDENILEKLESIFQKINVE